MGRLSNEEQMDLDASEMDLEERSGALHVALGKLTQVILHCKDKDRDRIINEAWGEMAVANKRYTDAWSRLESTRRRLSAVSAGDKL